MNILLSTFGQTWQIVPELVGLVNPDCVPLYNNYPLTDQLQQFKKMAGGNPVDEVWLILTNDSKSVEAFNLVKMWYELLSMPRFVLRGFVCQSASQLADAAECRAMADYIMRVVLKASSCLDGGCLLLSLAGGRKTMSADLQRAATFFGCRLLFHVADNLAPDALLRQRSLDPALLTVELPSQQIEGVFPVVVAHYLQPGMVASLPHPLTCEQYPVEQSDDSSLIAEIERREAQTRNLLHNSYINRRRGSPSSYFHGLQLLPPELITQLETSMIGIDKRSSTIDFNWLCSLPKADLHCHLGGVLDAGGMIEAACANGEAVDRACRSDSSFKQWLTGVKMAVLRRDRGFFEPWSGNWKTLRGFCKAWPQSTNVSGFLRAFRADPDFLDYLIFDTRLQEERYCATGIGHYEGLGDLQGSALLGCEAALRYTLQFLINKCALEHVTYCEVRCSPAKYATRDMPVDHVLRIIRHELMQAKSTRFKIIIIASRHAPMSEIKQHVNLVSSFIKEEGFDDWFAGFDLAGDEQKMKPGELRGVFDPLLRDCINVTIHAGETASVSNIWEAAYMLQADRIGHGLTLKNDTRLMKRFAERGIALEMCPSSNFQVVGFADTFLENTHGLDRYPLRQYIENGLIVTINTDNRGISRTTLSHEYLKAARLTPGGLSKWEILQLIRNGFKSAFVGRQMRKQLLIDAEEQLLKLLIS